MLLSRLLTLDIRCSSGLLNGVFTFHSSTSLLLRCPDLEVYVKEVSPLKKNLLLINKADLLTGEQREAWSSYLTKQGLDFAFFSALEEEEGEAAGKNYCEFF